MQLFSVAELRGRCAAALRGTRRSSLAKGLHSPELHKIEGSGFHLTWKAEDC